jgi:hypothetical protein
VSPEAFYAAQDGRASESFFSQTPDDGLIERATMPRVGLADVDA